MSALYEYDFENDPILIDVEFTREELLELVETVSGKECFFLTSFEDNTVIIADCETETPCYFFERTQNA